MGICKNCNTFCKYIGDIQTIFECCFCLTQKNKMTNKPCGFCENRLEKKKIEGHLAFLKEIEKWSDEQLGIGVRSEIKCWIDNMEFLLKKKKTLTEKDEGGMDIFYGIKETFDDDPDIDADCPIVDFDGGDDLGI